MNMNLIKDIEDVLEMLKANPSIAATSFYNGIRAAFQDILPSLQEVSDE